MAVVAWRKSCAGDSERDRSKIKIWLGRCRDDKFRADDKECGANVGWGSELLAGKAARREERRSKTFLSATQERRRRSRKVHPGISKIRNALTKCPQTTTVCIVRLDKLLSPYSAAAG
jgi:hypothetical protein